jgi:hypothetical protein
MRSRPRRGLREPLGGFPPGDAECFRTDNCGAELKKRLGAAARLLWKTHAAPKTINEEVGFLLRMLLGAGDAIRARLRRQKMLKLAVGKRVGKAYSPEEKEALLAAAKTARSPAIYPALMLALSLDTKLTLGPDAARADVLKSMDGHILAKAALEGRFHR